MMQPPSGTVTFLFTDIQGSTKLWEQHHDGMDEAIKCHDALMTQAVEAHNGYVFKTVGDAFCVAFPSAIEAIMATIEAQKFINFENWGETKIKVRMGLHTGEANERGGDYFGPTINRTARLMGIGHGGQILLSQSTYDRVSDSLPEASSLLDLGHHRLKDLAEAQQVYQLVHPDLNEVFPDLNSLSYLANNLPAQTTSFVGRESDIELATNLLNTSRMVTLTGIGGTGKTRLSLQVAANLIEQYADGVWFVELASVSDPSRVSNTLAEVLNVSEMPGQSTITSLKDFLQNKNMLVVLDNCEHVLDACADVATNLLKSCPNVQILASSREELGVRGETVCAIAPLPLPEQQTDVDTLLNIPSVELFIERARLAKPNFDLTTDNAEAIAYICQRLDGIPFALELAAARVKTLPPQKLVERLDDRFRYLTSGRREEPDHHQTLRATIDWSYDLINDSEKILLNRLSVFQGRFILEAAEAICSNEDLDELLVMDDLSRLVQKSLVEVDEQHDELFYRLLETVRQYAQEKLEATEAVDKLKDQHLKFFADLANNIDSQVEGVDEVLWYRKFHLLHDNFRAALHWGLQHKNASYVYETCKSLASFWFVHGHMVEAQSWMLQALQQREGVPQDLQAEILLWAGNYTVDLGDNEAGRDLIQESMAISQEINDQNGIASALTNLGVATNNLGDLEGAKQIYEKAIHIYQTMGEEKSIATALNNLGNVILEMGDLKQARRLFEESKSICKKFDIKQGLAIALDNLGTVSLKQDDLVSSRIHFSQCVKIYHDIGDKFGVANSFSGFSLLLEQEGQPKTAAQLQGACEKLLNSLHIPLEPAEKSDFDQLQKTLQKVLRHPVYQNAFEQGQQLSVDRAINLALNITDQ